MSLVVPAIALTIALSSLSNAFNSVLLPALGLPTMATFTPLIITLPSLKDAINDCTFVLALISNSLNLVRSANSTSSSAKSSSSSVSALNSMSCSLIAVKSFLNPPFKL